MSNSTDKPTIAIVGGTGLLGPGWRAGWRLPATRSLIGSRQCRQGPGCGAIARRAGGRQLRAWRDQRGGGQGWRDRDRHRAVAEPGGNPGGDPPAVAGKLVIDTTVPLVPPKVARVQLPPEQSAALAAQQRLGPGVRVVAAFHTIAAHKLQSDEPIDCDVLVFGDEPKDREVVIALAHAIGLRGIHAGPLANSVAAEALTSVLIGINRAYKADGAGIRITGIAGS